MKEIIVISDFHLGSDVCHSDNILEFLDKIDPDNQELVLNGDIMDNLTFHRLKHKHWKILKKIRKIAEKTKVVWTKGNHDDDAEVVGHLLGVEYVDKYEIRAGSKKVVIRHGDRFDAYIRHFPITAKIADFFYRLIQRFDKLVGNDYYISTRVKKNSKTFLGATETMSLNAIEYCYNNKYDAIICGHTHRPHVIHNLEKEISFYNCGCWTDNNPHYISIDKDKITLNPFTPSTQEPLIL